MVSVHGDGNEERERVGCWKADAVEGRSKRTNYAGARFDAEVHGRMVSYICEVTVCRLLVLMCVYHTVGSQLGTP